MSDRFYTHDPLAPGELTLSGQDAHHLATVRRYAPGDRVVLFNGDGAEYPAEVIAVAKKEVCLTVLSRETVCREVRQQIVVGSALPKGDRTDYLIEKLVEVGATRFVPLITERSVVIPKETTIAKLNRAVIEASKQCGRNALMRIDRPHLWAEFVATADLPVTRWVLHTAPEVRSDTRGRGESGAAEGVAIAVGPEGGFTAEEVGIAVGNGWQTLTLGPRVLRVETAAVVATAWAADGG